MLESKAHGSEDQTASTQSRRFSKRLKGLNPSPTPERNTQESPEKPSKIDRILSKFSKSKKTEDEDEMKESSNYYSKENRKRRRGAGVGADGGGGGSGAGVGFGDSGGAGTGGY